MEYGWILSHFDQGAKAGQKNHRQFVTGALGKDKDNPLRQSHGQLVLGSEEFIGKIKALLKYKVMGPLNF